MFLAKNRGASEVQSKHQEAVASVNDSSAAAAQPSLSSSAPAAQSALAESAEPPHPPSQPQPTHSDALIALHAPVILGLPASPIPLRATHASIFSSPSAGSSPAASSACDTALLSAQVIDLRRRLSECERDKDGMSREHTIRMQEALDAAAALRLELQAARDQAFEDSEALRVQHQQALDNVGVEISHLQHSANLSKSEKVSNDQRLHLIEGKLADAMSRLEVAQEKLTEQAALCTRSQARAEELQLKIANQTQEISSWDAKLKLSLITFQQRECELQDIIQTDCIAHKQVVDDLRSHNALLSTELKASNSNLLLLQTEIDNLRRSCRVQSVDDSISAVNEAEIAKLRSLLQESTDNSAIDLSKLQSECILKEQHLAAVRHELILSQAAVAEAANIESNLKFQLQSLQLQLNQKQKDIQEQKSVVSSPALLSPGDSTALEASTRRTTDIERKYFTNHSVLSCHFIICLIQVCCTCCCSGYS